MAQFVTNYEIFPSFKDQFFCPVESILFVNSAMKEAIERRKNLKQIERQKVSDERLQSALTRNYTLFGNECQRKKKNSTKEKLIDGYRISVQSMQRRMYVFVLF